MGLPLSLCLWNCRKPFSPALNLFRNAHAVRDIGTIGKYHFPEKLGRFGLNLLFLLAGMLLAQGLAFVGIRLKLAAIRAHPSQLQYIYLARGKEYLGKQCSDLGQKALSKIASSGDQSVLSGH
jgi:hypothetical protein